MVVHSESESVREYVDLAVRLGSLGRQHAVNVGMRAALAAAAETLRPQPGSDSDDAESRGYSTPALYRTATLVEDMELAYIDALGARLAIQSGTGRWSSNGTVAYVPPYVVSRPARQAASPSTGTRSK